MNGIGLSDVYGRGFLSFYAISDFRYDRAKHKLVKRRETVSEGFSPERKISVDEVM